MNKPTADRKAEARRVALAAAIGTPIEWYDFFIYGTAAETRIDSSTHGAPGKTSHV